MFFEKLRLWSQEYPPADCDKALQATLAPLKIDVQGHDSPYVGADPTFAEELEAGSATGERTLQTVLTSGSSPEVKSPFAESWSGPPLPGVGSGATTPTKPRTS
jgi:hypothetical protein